MGGLLTVGRGVFAAEGTDTFNVALIGCGGRGNGAIANAMEAAANINLTLKLVATADVFKEKAEKTGVRFNLPKERCFGGFPAYRHVMESEADLILLATPPNFRPLHFEAAVNAGKHVFMEKPVAVDPPGARRIIAAGELAKQKGLAVVAGTQRRHQKAYRETAAALEQGALGNLLNARVWWCQDDLWLKTRKLGENDAEYLVRNWVNFTEMSGDHIVEQHVHNLDVANWFLGRTPISALGFGGRARRETGNQYDFFSVEIDYGEGVAVHSMCRQINGCYNRVSEFFTGSAGTTWGSGPPESKADKDLVIPEFPDGNPYVIEHLDLLNSIRAGKPLNEARQVAESTLTAIMGRISAYTGQLVRWIDLTKNTNSPYYNLILKPTAEDFESGKITAPKDGVAPVPGSE